MTTNKKWAFYADPDITAALTRTRADSGVPVSRIVNMALREFLPPFETRKQLREATLAVGRRQRRKTEGR